MPDLPPIAQNAVLLRIRSQAVARDIRISQHGHQEMVQDAISLQDTLDSISNGQIIEN